MNIKTVYEYPPVPVSGFWIAYDDDPVPVSGFWIAYDDDPGADTSPYGQGATEQEAIDDLMAQLEDAE